jgi:hypothetical protein
MGTSKRCLTQIEEEIVYGSIALSTLREKDTIASLWRNYIATCHCEPIHSKCCRPTISAFSDTAALAKHSWRLLNLVGKNVRWVIAKERVPWFQAKVRKTQNQKYLEIADPSLQKLPTIVRKKLQPTPRLTCRILRRFRRLSFLEHGKW